MQAQYLLLAGVLGRSQISLSRGKIPCATAGHGDAQVHTHACDQLVCLQLARKLLWGAIPPQHSFRYPRRSPKHHQMATRFGAGDRSAGNPDARTHPQPGCGAPRYLAGLAADVRRRRLTPAACPVDRIARLSLDNIADGVADEYVREDVELATAEAVRMSRRTLGGARRHCIPCPQRYPDDSSAPNHRRTRP